MKIALPISHLINCYNFDKIPADAYELRAGQSTPEAIMDSGKDLHWHSSLGCMKNGFLFMFSDWAKKCGKKMKSYSCTLGPAVRDYRIDGWRYRKCNHSPPMTKLDIYVWFRAVVKRMKENYDGIIAFENTNGYPYPEYEHVTDPDFISGLIVGTDVGFVFDLAHAAISTHYRQEANGRYTFDEYISRLPLDRVVGVHLSSPGLVSGDMRDCHRPPDDMVFNLFVSIIDRLPEDCYVAIEYYDTFEVLEKIYKKLREVVK